MPHFTPSLKIFYGPLLLAALIGGSVFAGEPVRAGRYKGYNLLVISITNIGTEHMSLYGYGRKTTPELDKWAGGALVFEDAFTPASWTLPVATSLFTALSPSAHQIVERYRDTLLSEKIKTMPEILSASGYRTAAFTGGLDYRVSLGHMRGFAAAPDNPPFTKFDVTIPQAADWLSKNRNGRFFLFVHGYDAHPPFLPSKGFEGVFSSTAGRNVTVDPARTYRGYRESKDANITAYYHEPRTPPVEGKKRPSVGEVKAILTPDDVTYLTDLYDENIMAEDRAVGDFLGSLGKELLDKTIVVVLSEHGEMFAKHGRFGRAGGIRGTLYDDVVHVPLMIRLPGVQGMRVRGLVQLVDVMPTLLELLAVPLKDKVQGTSLLPLVNTGKPVNEFVYGGTKYNSYMPETYAPYGFSSINEFIRDYNWKLIHEITFPDPKEGKAPGGPEETFELYDIKGDPGEAVNLAAGRPEIVKDLSAKLRKLLGSSRGFVKNGPTPRETPEDVREKAKQHGYW
ncbi:MAG: sulfatase [Elusimicrobia bacterium]|nr:sulfatase [Elusimicrobiota bacterium]